MELNDVRKLADAVKDNISRVLVGIGDTLDLVLISLLCGGHVLLEDVPGVGKTMLAKCLARSLECGYKRIQFTPDLLPSDLTGINYYDQKNGEFIFRPGPVFTNIVLADEINRATPRTQSSLLECMEERQVTVDCVTRKLHSLFFVIATQNPVETRGTFPLPEAQLDRFFMRLRLGYPDPGEGMEILMRFRDKDPLAELGTVASEDSVIQAQKAVTSVTVSDASARYIIDIIEATRHDEKITLGVSPRGSIALMKAAQVKAVLEGRDFITPDDVKKMAVPVLAHRIMIKGHAISSGTENAENTIRDILNKVPVPTEEI
ncbi:MAG: MoxR family ATPase [Clostridiaceae bacterium]|nr:MoxR family ATPase [Clostridiaceae bacterium]